MEDKELYHGSKSGIVGEIKPISRARCDFGKGFYMGTDPLQVKSLVARFEAPVIYTVKFKLSEIPENRIFQLDDNKRWLYAILANRDAVKPKNLPYAQAELRRMERCDVVIGNIADDSIREALCAFYENRMPDENLIACLQKINCGAQYVAKTDFACQKIEIIDEQPLKGSEKKKALRYGARMRERCFSVVEAENDGEKHGEYLAIIINKQKRRDMYI